MPRRAEWRWADAEGFGEMVRHLSLRAILTELSELLTFGGPQPQRENLVETALDGGISSAMNNYFGPF